MTIMRVQRSGFYLWPTVDELNKLIIVESHDPMFLVEQGTRALVLPLMILTNDYSPEKGEVGRAYACLIRGQLGFMRASAFEQEP